MPIRFGRYELLERISLGGMAEVFKAQIGGAAGFEKIVAIKRILPQFSDDERFVKMFIEEAMISANLTHANIGQVYDFGQIDGRYFIAMEYIPGKDLAAVQLHFKARSQTMPVPMAIRVGLDLASALHYAHSKRDASGQLLRIVHRDVSPPNVIISFDGCVKLIDFGIAKALSRSSKTATGLLKGKYGYLSPEQADGTREIDARSDLFSLGTVLFELVTGERLFHAETEMGVVLQVRRAEIPSIGDLNPSCPGAFEGIIRLALARDPDDRFQSADELYEALENLSHSGGLRLSTMDLARWMGETFELAPDLHPLLRGPAVTLKPEPALQTQPPGGALQAAGSQSAAGATGEGGPRTRMSPDSAVLAAQMADQSSAGADEDVATTFRVEDTGETTSRPATPAPAVARAEPNRDEERSTRPFSAQPAMSNPHARVLTPPLTGATAGSGPQTNPLSADPYPPNQTAGGKPAGLKPTPTPEKGGSGPKSPPGAPRRPGSDPRRAAVSDDRARSLGSGLLGLSRGARSAAGPRRGGAASAGGPALAPGGTAPGRPQSTKDEVQNGDQNEDQIDTLRPGVLWAKSPALDSWKQDPPTTPGPVRSGWEQASSETTDAEGEAPTGVLLAGRAEPSPALQVRTTREGMSPAGAEAYAEMVLDGKPASSGPAALPDPKDGGWDDITTNLQGPEQEKLRKATAEGIDAAEVERLAKTTGPTQPGSPGPPQVWEDTPTTVHLAELNEDQLETLRPPERPEVVVPAHVVQSELDATVREIPGPPLPPPTKGMFEDGPTTVDMMGSTVALRELSAQESFPEPGAAPAPPAAATPPLQAAVPASSEQLIAPSSAFVQARPVDVLGQTASALRPINSGELAVLTGRSKPLLGSPALMPQSPPVGESPAAFRHVVEDLPSYIQPPRPSQLGRWILIVSLLAITIGAGVGAGLLMARRQRAATTTPGSGQTATNAVVEPGSGSVQPGSSKPVTSPLLGPDAGVQPAAPDGSVPKPALAPPDQVEPQPKAKKAPKHKRLRRPRPRTKVRARPEVAVTTPRGFLAVSSKPWARVLVDGRDTGHNTPIAVNAPLSLAVGRHKVTLVCGKERFDFTVEIKPGETTKLIEALPVSAPDGE